MTAEIAVLNRTAIALAADSAVTVGRERVWKNTNKLFSLSPENDIGVMIYNVDDFCGIPRETVIKSFIQQRNKEYTSIDECKEDLLAFLAAFPVESNAIAQLNLHILLVNVVEDCLAEQAAGKNKIEKRNAVRDHLEEIGNNISNSETVIDGIEYKDFIHAYGDFIDDAIDEEAEIHITNEIRSRIKNICFDMFRKGGVSTIETGIVVAGFGASENLPRLRHFIVDGFSEFGLRAWEIQNINVSVGRGPDAYIVPFAQSDIAHLFMEGIEKDYIDFLDKAILGILGKKADDLIASYVPAGDRLVEEALQGRESRAATRALLEEFKELRGKRIVQPILRVVRSLPKEEMAAMAEALVEITSLRRKMDSKVESVSGPVDVAVISKGDGFIWIKRKHYFDIKYNVDFGARRRMRRSKGHE